MVGEGTHVPDPKLKLQATIVAVTPGIALAASSFPIRIKLKVRYIFQTYFSSKVAVGVSVLRRFY